MKWLSQLANALNVFKKTPSIERPISTVSLTLAERAVGSTTSDSTPGGRISNQDTGKRALRRRWRRLAKRFPDSAVNRSDRWGMLTQLYSGGQVCRCLACRQEFTTWEDGRTHECKQEKSFRKITQRYIPGNSSKNEERPGGVTAGDLSDRSGVEPDRVGVVADSSQPGTSRSRSHQRRERNRSGESYRGDEAAQGSVRDPGPGAGIDSDREADTKP